MQNKPEVFVIDGITDGINPEDGAMIQALYSRDPRSVIVHLAKVKEVGPGKFMEQYYVGYGHKSIGDCGTTNVFVEQVSMLVAKAIQQWPLYSGQEASTRYLDMSAQPLINPLGTKEGEQILTDWLTIYKKALESLVPFLEPMFPMKEGENPKVWQKAIKAKAFDIARSFLPAGAATLLSWHTNLRQAADHLKQLRHHPLKEVRDVAEEIESKLKAKYPGSFSHRRHEDDEAYVKMCSQAVTYSDSPIKSFSAVSRLDLKGLKSYKKLLGTRPAKSELPQELRAFGDIRFKFLIDFGSYRDLQRHRSMVHAMPLLSTKHGFHPWYLASLPPEFKKYAVTEIEKLTKRINALKCNDADRQYYIGMGFRVACDISCSLPSAVYIAELRSGQLVHPTLRPIAQNMGEWLKKNVPGIAMHHDMSPDQWTIKRGTQDIQKKS